MNFAEIVIVVVMYYSTMQIYEKKDQNTPKINNIVAMSGATKNLSVFWVKVLLFLKLST